MVDRIEKRVEFLTKAWLAWFGVYMLLGARASMAGETSFLAAAVDDVDTLWVKAIFLNIPLQLILALTGFLLCRSSKLGCRRIGFGVAIANTTLVFVHVVISIYFAFIQ
jgi:hypothetical protein